MWKWASPPSFIPAPFHSIMRLFFFPDSGVGSNALGIWGAWWHYKSHLVHRVENNPIYIFRVIKPNIKVGGTEIEWVVGGMTPSPHLFDDSKIGQWCFNCQRTGDKE